MIIKYIKRKLNKLIYKRISNIPKEVFKDKTIACELGVQIDSLTKIGSYSYVGPYTTITKSKVGRYVSIGRNVIIGVGEHSLEKRSLNALFYEKPYEELTKKDEAIIGDDVWIGSNSFIKRGVKIGRGAVIGANSVVTKDVPAYTIIVGINKVLRKRFSEKEIEIIEMSKWWEEDELKAKKMLLNLEKKLKNI